jgi:ATP/maltotriose-dependent transcriptional regulator MalT
VTEAWRPRVAACIDAAARGHVALVIAPAGFGKSRALQAYLATCKRPATVVAIDGLESADAEAIAALVEAITRTRGRISWILASRTTEGLPLGTWRAYGDADAIVDESQLCYTRAELNDDARAYGLTTDPRELDELHALTGGWPAAVDFALRELVRTGSLTGVRKATRDAMYRLASEQIFPTLTGDEMETLEFASLLPRLDSSLVERAGFERARAILEGVRNRVPPMEVFRYRVSLMDRTQRERLYTRAAQTLEEAGDVERALETYVAGRAHADVLRVLREAGFELIERARVDAVSNAIVALDEKTRREHPHVLTLRGVIYAANGKPARAEALIARALARTNGDRDLAATAGTRLALLMANRGCDVEGLLAPIAGDLSQSAANRAEALSLLAARRALARDFEGSKTAARAVEELLPHVDLDLTRAKVLQRIGVAAVNTGDVERARNALEQAADVATELGLHSIASRAFASLSNLMRHHFDDVLGQMRFAESAAHAAAKSGDQFDLQTALIQMASAQMRQANDSAAELLEERLTSLHPISEGRAPYLNMNKALRFAWAGRFREAHQLMARCRTHLHYDFDRLVHGAQCALFLAMDGRRDASANLATESLRLASEIEVNGLFALRHRGIARLYCVVAEAANGRVVHAERAARQIGRKTGDAVIEAASRSAGIFLAARRRGTSASPDPPQPFDDLRSLGYADVARTLDATDAALARRGERPREPLTPAELSVLEQLGEGLSPKEIAERTGRSVFTIRAHSANAFAKLRSRGRGEAVALARRLGIIS